MIHKTDAFLSAACKAKAPYLTSFFIANVLLGGNNNNNKYCATSFPYDERRVLFFVPRVASTTKIKA